MIVEGGGSFTIEKSGSVTLDAGVGVSIINDSFTDDGEMVVTAGTVNLAFSGGAAWVGFTPGAGGTAGTLASAGEILVQTGATLDLALGDTIGTIAQFIDLDGPGATIAAGSGSTFASLATTLAAIGSNGTLELQDGAFTDANTIQLSGEILLQPGTISAALNLAASGTLSGGGVVTGTTLGGTGTVAAATGGSLALDVGGIGAKLAVPIDAGAKLELGTIADTGTITFEGATGALLLDLPAKFAGHLAGVAAGDELVLSGVDATAATLGSGTLTVTLKSGGTEKFKVAGTATSASVSSNAGGMATILFGSAAAALTAADLLPALPPSPPRSWPRGRLLARPRRVRYATPGDVVARGAPALL